MVPELTLRPALPADEDQISTVRLRARREAPMPPPVQTGCVGASGAAQTWVAVDDSGTVVGLARFTATWLEDLYVDPDVQRRGIGAALLDMVKSHLRDGFGLWVFESNRPARDFYAAQHLLELERTDGTANEEGEPDIHLVWPGEEPLAYLRRCIDEVDEALADVLARRVALTRAVQVHKRTTLAGGDPGRDAVREAEIVARMVQRVPELGTDRLARIMHAIITASFEVQR